MALPSSVLLHAPALPLVALGESHSKQTGSEPQEKGFPESLGTLTTGVMLGMSIQGLAGGGREWNFLRVSQVAMGAFAIAGFVSQEMARQERKNQQGHGIG